MLQCCCPQTIKDNKHIQPRRYVWCYIQVPMLCIHRLYLYTPIYIYMLHGKIVELDFSRRRFFFLEWCQTYLESATKIPPGTQTSGFEQTCNPKDWKQKSDPSQTNGWCFVTSNSWWVFSMHSVRHRGLSSKAKATTNLRVAKRMKRYLHSWREFKWLSSTNVSTHNIIPTVPNIYRFSRRLNPLRPWDPTSASSQISMSMMVSLLSKLLPQKSCHGNCYLVDVHNMMISEIVNDINKRCVCIHNIIFVWLFRLKVRESNFFAKQRKTSHATPWPLPERWMLKPINQSTVLEKIKPIVVWSDNFREKNTVLKQFQSINNHTRFCVYV